MNKRASVELVILGLVAVIALVGLVLLFTGKLTGEAAGQPMTRQVLANEEEFRIERPGGYLCECSLRCVYDGRTERATSPITQDQTEAIYSCQKTLVNRCAPQPWENFDVQCVTR